MKTNDTAPNDTLTAPAQPISSEAGAAKKPPHCVDLDTPIVRGSHTITQVTLRKPRSGELRGLTLTDVMNLDVNAMQKLLPRISSPTLTEQEVAAMDPADLVQLGVEVAGFLLTKAAKQGFQGE